MDNLAAPIPSTPPQPTVSSLPVESLAKAGPVESPNRRRVLWLAGGLVMLIIGIAIGVFGVKFLNQSQNPSPLTSTPTPTLLPIPSPAPDLNREPSGSAATADWKIFSDELLQISFKYPNYYQILEKNKTNIVFGAKPSPDAIKSIPYLKIYSGYKTSLQLPKCSDNRDVIIRCLIYGNQISPIMEIKIDNRDAKSFYIAEGVTFQIIQVSNPKLEIEMNISGGGLKYTFDQILSTFHFLK